MDKKELFAVLGTVVVGAWISYMLEHPFSLCRFYESFLILACGILLMYPVLTAKSITEEFREWLKRHIKKGEDLYNNSDLKDEVKRSDYSIPPQNILGPFDEAFNVWTIQRQRILKQAFGENSDSWARVQPIELEEAYLRHINNPEIWGGFRWQLRAEIDRLKQILETVQTSEHFSYNFKSDVIKEIERHFPSAYKNKKN